MSFDMLPRSTGKKQIAMCRTIFYDSKEFELAEQSRQRQGVLTYPDTRELTDASKEVIRVEVKKRQIPKWNSSTKTMEYLSE